MNEARSAESDGRASVDVALNIIVRLRATLRAETSHLQRQSFGDFHEFNLRKSQCLLELSRVAPLVQAGEADAVLAREVTTLRGELEENRRLLRMQLDAALEVTEIISRAFQDELSDGTYSGFCF